MLIDHFPLLGLTLTTPRVQLRLPGPQELAELADVAADGVHDPEIMPFVVAWTDPPAAERARSVVQHQWRTLGGFTPQAWSVPFTVFHDGRPVGLQSLGGKDFAVTREVSTGSWLGMRFHGQGIGTHMRAAVLHLAFAGLNADTAVSTAFDFNTSSLGVSRKLGYADDGLSRHVVRDRLAVSQRLRLTRDAWERHRRIEVEIDGLQSCHELLGLPAAAPLPADLPAAAE